MTDVTVLKDFAKEHDLILELNGEAGFGIKCVGFIKDGKFLDYNPYRYPKKILIKDLFDDIHYMLRPKLAYDKYDCMAVKGTDEESVRQLIEWVENLNATEVDIAEYNTGATGIQAENTGTIGYAIKINN
jgi:hypothetical protein